MKQLNKVLFALSLTGLLSCGEKTQKEQVSRRPNVLFILVDDLGYHDLGFTGSDYYETPNVDELAHSGIQFTQGYAASQVCSPSRASIMTGKLTATHGVTDWIGAQVGEQWHKTYPQTSLLPPDYKMNLPHEDITLAEAMKAAGYKTFFAGKWHLGGEGSYPEDHGFDINIGGWDSGSPKGGYFAPFNNPKLKEYPQGENLSMVLARETSAFIRSHKDSTFFAMLSFYAVHGPIQTTEEKWSKYRDKAEAQGIAEQGFELERRLPIRVKQDNPVYAGLVEQMDDAVGLVMETLDSLGLADNTIVVFTSDNGGVASGDAFSTSNLPLRGGKGYQWEGGIREPYVIKVPWIKDLREIEYPVAGHDFYPTLLDLANIPLPEDQKVDGISLKPLMEGKKIAERPIYWHYPHYGNQGGDPASSIRQGDWKLIHYWETGNIELYNLEEDPGEQNDRSNEMPEKARELDQELISWLKQRNVVFPEVAADFDPVNQEKAYKRMKELRKPQLEKEREEMLSKNYKPNENWWSSKVTKD
ncbi:sulfatase [Echinicola sediminis]